MHSPQLQRRRCSVRHAMHDVLMWMPIFTLFALQWALHNPLISVSWQLAVQDLHLSCVQALSNPHGPKHLFPPHTFMLWLFTHAVHDAEEPATRARAQGAAHESSSTRARRRAQRVAEELVIVEAAWQPAGM